MIPVSVEGANYGTVYFGSTAELENREEKVGLLSSLVNQTRIALTNSKLYGDMKENYIRTIKALATRSMRRTPTPTAIPRVS